MDDFGCAPGCSHAHCGRRTLPLQQQQQQQHLQQQDPGVGSGHSAAPGSLRLVGSASPAASPSRVGVVHRGLSQGDHSNDGSSHGSSRSNAPFHAGTLPDAVNRVHQQPLQQWPSTPLVPAPSATAAGPAADPFAASGSVADFPMPPAAVSAMHAVSQQSPQRPGMTAGSAAAAANGIPPPSANGFTQRQLSAFATASFQPFQDEHGDGSVGVGSAAGSPASGFQRLRQNSILSMSIRPLPSRDLAESAATAHLDSSGGAAADGTTHSSGAAEAVLSNSRRQHQLAAEPLNRSRTVAMGLLQRRGSAERPHTPTFAVPPSAAGPRMPSAGRLERGQSLGAALGAPPQVHLHVCPACRLGRGAHSLVVYRH